MEIKSNYSKQLTNPQWQKKRLEIMQRDEFMCQNCGDNESTLNVHHTYYSNCNVWDYEDCSLITLCYDCHNEITQLKKQAKSTIDSYFIFSEKLSYLNDIISVLTEFDVVDLNDIKNSITNKLLEI